MEQNFGISLFHKQFNLVCIEVCSSLPSLGLIPKTFRLGIEIFAASLDSDGLVIDFGVIKLAMKKVMKDFDHKILICSRTNSLEVHQEDQILKVTTPSEAVFRFPFEKCIVVKKRDSAALELCQAIGKKIKQAILGNQDTKKFSFKVYSTDDNFKTRSCFDATIRESPAS